MLQLYWALGQGESAFCILVSFVPLVGPIHKMAVGVAGYAAKRVGHSGHAGYLTVMFTWRTALVERILLFFRAATCNA